MRVIVVRGEGYRHVQVQEEVVSKFVDERGRVTRARWDWLGLTPGTTRVTYMYSKVRWQNILQETIPSSLPITTWTGGILPIDFCLTESY